MTRRGASDILRFLTVCEVMSGSEKLCFSKKNDFVFFTSLRFISRNDHILYRIEMRPNTHLCVSDGVKEMEAKKKLLKTSIVL